MYNTIYIYKSGLFFNLLRIAIVMCALSLYTGVNARDLLDVPVKLDVEKGSTEGVTVSIIRNGIPSATVDGRKNMTLKLEYNKNYTLVFKKQDYISKSIEFDTHAPKSVIDYLESYPIGVKLFRQNEENMVAYNQPVAHISFDRNLGDFTYSTDYSKSMLSEMDEIAEEINEDKDNTKHTTTSSPEEKQDAGYNTNASMHLYAHSENLKSNQMLSAGKTTEAVKSGNEISSVNGNDVAPEGNLFDKFSSMVTEQDYGHMHVWQVTVTRGDTVREYRKVAYNWGGVYYFEDNVNSISENVFYNKTTKKI